MKRAATALAALSCALFGCATQPPKLVYADGPGPHDFDCAARAGYYRSLNIHVLNGKLRIAGFIQFESAAEQPDPHWIRQAEIALQGPEGSPAVSLWGFIRQDTADNVHFALRYVLEPWQVNKILSSQTSPIFAVRAVADLPYAFELTMDESGQIKASVGTAETTISLPQIRQLDLVRASLTCSGTHVRYSSVTVNAQ